MHNFKKRRLTLSKQLQDNSVMVLFSGVELKKSADAVFDFSVNKNFYYLTGIKQANTMFVMIKKGDEIEERIYIDRYDAHKEKWNGRKLTPSEAQDISKVNLIYESEDFDTQFSDITKIITNVYLDLEPYLYIGPLKTTVQFADQIKNNPNIKVLNIYDEIIKLRMFKDDYEISLIKESISLTAHALERARQAIKPGLYEYEVAALFEYGIKNRHGELGFNTIAAGGVNATILHYTNLNDKLREDELLLLDLGGHHNMYTADISRTYPISKHFTPLQLIIYEIVLMANKKVIKFIKPGKTLFELQAFTQTFLKEALVSSGLMDQNGDINEYYYHGVSHHLGLDTHDASFRDIPLAPGHVITVEPGLYFKEYGIGVRIEDNILVTPDGALNLSIEIPKEVKDLLK